MTINKQNDCSGGTAGSAVTTGNSGGVSGDAFQTVYSGTGNTWQYQNMPGDSGVGIKQILAATSGGDLGWNPALVPVIYSRVRVILETGGVYTGNLYLFSTRNSTNSNSGLSIRLNASLQPRILNRNGFTYPWVSPVALVVGQEYQIESYMNQTTGAGGCRIWSGDGQTLLAEGTVSGQDWLANCDLVRWGVSGSALNGSIGWDDFAQAFDTWVGPVVSGGGPAEAALKAWDGNAWVDADLKVWSGGAWVDAPPKVWDGAAWTP